MKIYTKTGDTGTTSLVGGSRTRKDDARLDAYGTIDELNSWLGFIISLMHDSENTLQKEISSLIQIQNKLFDLGCALATEKDADWQPKKITESDISFLENEIDRIDDILPKHQKFILPGGTQSASVSHIARTVCRRAERIMVSLPTDTCISQSEAIAYINRLSDYLFVLARYINHKTGIAEIFWNP